MHMCSLLTSSKTCSHGCVHAVQDCSKKRSSKTEELLGRLKGLAILEGASQENLDAFDNADAALEWIENKKKRDELEKRRAKLLADLEDTSLTDIVGTSQRASEFGFSENDMDEALDDFGDGGDVRGAVFARIRRKVKAYSFSTSDVRACLHVQVIQNRIYGATDTGATKTVYRGTHHPNGRDQPAEHCAVLAVKESDGGSKAKRIEREYHILKALHEKHELSLEEHEKHGLGKSVRTGEHDPGYHTVGVQGGIICKEHIIKPLYFEKLRIAFGLQPCLVEELVMPIGFNLRELTLSYSNAKQIVPEMSVKFIVRQLCRGLAHMHHYGVIHRDLKPDNVMCRVDRQVKIIDFDHARAKGLLQEVFDHDSRRFAKDLIEDRNAPTNEDPRQGKTHDTCYIAPECKDGKPSDGGTAADLWGVGVISHYMLTGGTYSEQGGLVRGCDADKDDGYSTHSKQATLDHFSWGDLALKKLLKKEASARWRLSNLYSWAAHTRFIEPGTSKIQHFSEWAPNVFQFRIKAIPTKKFEAKTLRDMPEFSNCTSVVLGVENPSGDLQVRPGADTPIEEGALIHFGLANHVKMKPLLMEQLSEKHGLVTDIHDMRAKFERKRSGLLDLNNCSEKEGGLFGPNDVKCDAFDFPKWTHGCLVGRFAIDGKQGLDVRANFNLNLAGIVKGNGEIIWWPGTTIEITEGCRGLVARLPDSSGIARQTLTLDMVDALKYGHWKLKDRSDDNMDSGYCNMS